VVGAGGFVWAYATNRSNYWLGGFLALGFIGIGFGLAYWGRNLLGERSGTSDYPIPRERDDEGRAELASDLRDSVQVVTRRRFLAGLLVGAAGLFGLSQIVLLGSLGPLPHRRLFKTSWKAGSRVVAFDGRPVMGDALSTGGYMVVYPEGHLGAADSQVILLRFSSDVVKPLPGRESWSPNGFYAYSRVCTHAGCPVAQYEDQALILACPCHQSAFDLRNGAKPIFGPAGRALPQLPLMIDAQGHLRAQSGFKEAIGPGFWDLP
jgi:ubiquinol-cytochrome c reductase iron-sulfur subunit